MIKLIIFDLDGVLVDALPLHEQALIQALKEVVNVEITPEHHQRVYAHRPTLKKLEMMAEKGLFEKRYIQKISQVKQSLTRDLIPNTIIPLHNTIDAIHYLKVQYGATLVCASNSIRITLIEMLQTLGIFGYFDYLISNEDVYKPKPDSEMYLKAMEKFEISSDETLIVEDSPVGLRAAIDSGAHVLEIFNPYVLNLDLIKNRLNLLNGGIK